MQLLRTREQLDAWRTNTSGTVALVPTMGALHEGHLTHLDVARREVGPDGKVLVSVFVNPTQFGPSEDFERYPRNLGADAARCEARGADAIFCPSQEEMYLPNEPASEINVPGVASELEGALRPGHFAGVCRVVMKLLGLVRPDVATFGTKDFQQLAVIRALVADLCVPVRIVEVPTQREPDGLAMSSRNAYLDADQRRRAAGIFEALKTAEGAWREGQRDPARLEEAMRAVLAGHGFTGKGVDYATVRDPVTLAQRIDPAGPTVALIAVRAGATRLIDNLALKPTD
ncbi:MAG: pantoate--beta-alanine ligase [Planctomycetota bacterium]